nr:translocation/assembly module TamB [Mesonia aestuariivivens]
MLFFIVLVLVFSIPAVQTGVAHKLTNTLNETYGTNINVKSISISYSGKVVLDEVFIADHHQDSLISAKEINTSLINLPAILSGKHLDFGDLTANGLKLKIRHYKGEEKDNLSFFGDQFNTGQPQQQPFVLTINHIITYNSEFSYVDENLEASEVLFFDNLNINAANLVVDGTDVSVNIESLRAKEQRGIDIENLATRFRYTSTKMVFEDLLLETQHSKIASDIQFDYEEGGLADFENNVRITANFEESKADTKDLKKLYKEFGNTEKFTFEGKLEGKLNDFELNDWRLTGMDRSAISGNLKFKDLINQEKNFQISGNLNRFSTNYYDLVNLLPTILGNSLPKKLKEVGNLTLTGFISVTPTRLETNSLIATQLGNANLNVILNDLNDPDFIRYQGNIKMNRFNLGRLLGNASLGYATFNLNVDGVGSTQETLNTQINGTINRLKFNGYTYKNIEVLGVFDHPNFNGKLIGNDPNFKFEFNGLANVSQTDNVYDFKASVAYADLNALNFVKRDSIAIMKGDIVLNVEGNNFNDAKGNLYLQNFSYQNQDELFEFEELQLSSTFNNNVRKIVINSPDVISGEVEGIFKVEEVPSLFQNAIGSLYANYEPISIEGNQYLDFNFDIYNKIVEVFFPDIELAANTFIKGNLASEDSEFKLTFRSPQINVLKNKFDKVNLQIDNSNPLFNTYIKVDSISTPYYNASEFNLINVTLNDTLFVRSEFKGGSQNNDNFNISFFHTINDEQKSVVGLKKSNIKFKESEWFINNENTRNQKIVFEKDLSSFKIDTLTFTHENELISLTGEARDSTYKNFKLNFNHVDLAKITPDIDSISLKGMVNGKLDFYQENGIYYPTSSLAIDSIAVNNINYGNLKLNIDGNEDLTQYNIKALLGNKEYDFLRAKGGINVSEENPNINLDVNLDSFKLNAFSALGADVITDIRGLVFGNAKVTGDYRNPDISGRLTLNNAGLKIPYLNVDLNLQQNAVVDLTNQEFIFNNVDVVDTKYKTKGIIDGTISHQAFSNWNLDLDILAPERLVVLDTKFTEDALYYGTAFISGNANISGPTEELVIDVVAKTEEGTIFEIPLSDTEAIGDNSFIYFLTPEEKLARQQGKEIKIKEVKGLELNFELDVTNEAEVEIVVDKNSGSTLAGSGAGTLLIEINTNGKFNMWGDFVVYDGVYNFKYAGLVQKEFKVVSGGNITWDGSPTRADLNVRALYKTEANPAILLENPIINRNIPVEVYIDLNGELTETDLTFNLEYPNLSSVVKSELEYRISDRQSTEIQALSLITQGSFYSQYTVGQNAPGNLIAERASGLFDDIFADDDGKFKIGIDYVQGDRTPDQTTADRFGLSLSTNITEKILINGRVGVPIGGVTQSVVVGNVEVELLLNEEGTLRANLFNRENTIQYIGQPLGYTQGVGLSYAVDFDTFRELIYKILNKELKLEEVSKEMEIDQKTLAPDYIKFPEK